MLAMALIVVMPAVSRVMPMDAPMPGAMMGMGAACPDHGAGMTHAGTPDRAPAHAADRCGYCVLFDHHSVLASGKLLHQLPVAPGVAVPVVAAVDDAYASPILSAHPRGPPRLG
nr:DUF2946 domain-containing protein [Dyella sp. RRB7]